jgi:hypothetical protein
LVCLFVSFVSLIVCFLLVGCFIVFFVIWFVVGWFVVGWLVVSLVNYFVGWLFRWFVG